MQLPFISSIRRDSPLVLPAKAVFFLLLIGSCGAPVFAQRAATTTTIQASTSESQVGTPVTLTATVSAVGTPVSPGRVQFCDATAPYCDEFMLLGEAQLRPDGTAVLVKLLGIGQHQVYAKFVGTNTKAPSSSLPQRQQIDVAGKHESKTVIAKSGSAGNYTLTATVTGLGRPEISGPVFFQDPLNHHRVLGGGFLGDSSPGYTLDWTGNFGPLLYPTGVQVSDMDGDGFPDVLIDHFENDEFFIFHNDPHNPGRNFPRQDTINSGGHFPTALVTADLNGDGLKDMAIVNMGITPDGAENNISIVLADAAHPGQYLPPVIYNEDSYPFRMAAGDFNGDGLLDIIYTSWAYPDNGLALMLADPAHPGTYLPKIDISFDYQAANLSVGDFNRDGRLDFIVSSYTSSDESALLHLYLADPSHPGQFLAPVIYSSPGVTGPLPVFVADFNHDGLPDVAALGFVRTSSPPGRLTVYLNDSGHPGQLLPATVYPVMAPVSDIGSVAMADMNQDGFFDFVVLGSLGPFDILFADPSHPGTFLPVSILPKQPGPWAQYFAAGDLNGDGFPDIAGAGVDAPGQVYLGSLTQTASVSVHALPEQNVTIPVAKATYLGNEDYVRSHSCSINLAVNGTPPPVISDITVSNITSTSARISWKTDVPTLGYVEYAPDPQLEFRTPVSENVSTYHSAVVSDHLWAGATVDYKVHAIAYYSDCQSVDAPSAMGSFQLLPE